MMSLKNERDELKEKLNELSMSSTMPVPPKQGQPGDSNCMPVDISSSPTAGSSDDILVMDSMLEQDLESDPLARMDTLLQQLQVRCAKALPSFDITIY